MRRLQILILLFLGLFLAIAALSVVAMRQVNRSQTQIAAVDAAQESLRRLDGLEIALKDIERLERGYLLTADTAYLPRIESAIRFAAAQSAHLQHDSGVAEAERRDALWLRTALADRVHILRQELPSRAGSMHADTSVAARRGRFTEGQRLTREATMHIDSLRAARTRVLLSSVGQRRTGHSRTTVTIRTLFVLFGIAGVVLFLLLMNEALKRLRYEEEARRRLAEVRRSNAELDQIAYAVSHHLQEPLRKIRILGDMLLHRAADGDTATTEATLTRIGAAAGRAHALITGLMGFTALAAEREEPLQPVDLAVVVREEIEAVRPMLDEASAHVEVGPDLPIVSARRRHMHLLFAALIDNAVKFRHPGRPLHLHISAAPCNNNGVAGQASHAVCVADNGIGFPPALAHKMFQLFGRLSAEPDAGGQGIGLSLCERIMAMHGGSIKAEGAEGQGAAFSLLFP